MAKCGSVRSVLDVPDALLRVHERCTVSSFRPSPTTDRVRDCIPLLVTCTFAYSNRVMRCLPNTLVRSDSPVATRAICNAYAISCLVRYCMEVSTVVLVQIVQCCWFRVDFLVSLYLPDLHNARGWAENLKPRTTTWGHGRESGYSGLHLEMVT